MNFEWDINKAELNIKNHGIRFEEAEEVFLMRLLLMFMMIRIRILKNRVFKF